MQKYIFLLVMERWSKTVLFEHTCT